MVYIVVVTEIMVVASGRVISTFVIVWRQVAIGDMVMIGVMWVQHNGVFQSY